MTTYLIFRHGSNAANQSMTPVACVGQEEAVSRDAAREQAARRINCYANQQLEARPASRCSQADCEEASEFEQARELDAAANDEAAAEAAKNNAMAEAEYYEIEAEQDAWESAQQQD